MSASRRGPAVVPARLDGVLGTAEPVLARHDSVDDLIDRVTGQITEMLGVTRTRFVAGPVHDSRPAVLGHDGTVTRAGRRSPSGSSPTSPTGRRRWAACAGRCGTSG